MVGHNLKYKDLQIAPNGSQPPPPPQQQQPPLKLGPVEPLKRRRVTRLCDECRRRKVKCHGQQPCIHCTVYSYECTYNQPSSRRRTVITNPALKQESFDQPLRAANPQQQQQVPPPPQVLQQQFQIQQQPLRDTSENSMAKTLQQCEIFIEKLFPDLKNVNIYKLTNVLNQLKNEKKDVELPDIVNLYNLTTRTNNGIPYTYSPTFSPNGYLPTATIDGSIETLVGKEIKIILPPKDIAIKLISSTWDNACVLFRFYHRPSFIKQLSILYETDPANYTDTQQKFLPLVYSVMACGTLFCKSAQLNKNPLGETELEREIFEDEGYKYFIAARKLVDITDTRDIYGIQTIVMLVIFLQCGARLSTCYSYVGIGLRAALREGFHKKLSYPFNPIQLEVRKRIFYTMLKMDIYVNTMLGLPFSLNESDYDQDLPVELDDENITEHGYNFKNQKGLSSSAIANSHTKLLMIMKRVAMQLYPMNKELDLSQVATNNIVYNLELDLQNWVNELPLELKPGIEPSPRYYKANLLLHFSYLHIKIILYRPFIHYVSRDTKNITNIDELKSVEMLKNCINVARIVVKLSEGMISKKMLSGSYWFSIYTIFFSVACLVYYVHFGPQVMDDEYMLIKKDAENGKKVLELLKNSSNAARRTFSILNSVFAQLNNKTARENGALKNNQPKLPLAKTKSSKVKVKLENNAIDDNLPQEFINNLQDIKPIPQQQQPPPQQPAQQQQPQQEQNFNTSNFPFVNNYSPSVTNNDNYLPEIVDGFDVSIFGKMLPSHVNADFNQVTKDLGNEILPNDDISYPIAVPAQDNNFNNLPQEHDEFLDEQFPGVDDGVVNSSQYNFDELLDEWAHDGAEFESLK